MIPPNNAVLYSSATTIPIIGVIPVIGEVIIALAVALFSKLIHTKVKKRRARRKVQAELALLESITRKDDA